MESDLGQASDFQASSALEIFGAALGSDFGAAFDSMILLVFISLGAFFIWQIIVMIILNNPEGDPTLKELIVSFFRRNRTRRPQPSDHRKNKNTQPPPSDLV